MLHCNAILFPGFGVITSDHVERAFRRVDRKFFVPRVREKTELIFVRNFTQYSGSRNFFALHPLLPFFSLQGNESIAHSDQPLKDGNVHISAPHIYASAIEALDLVPNSSMSFLNIGSGTGYISCIVAGILGANSLNYVIHTRTSTVFRDCHILSYFLRLLFSRSL